MADGGGLCQVASTVYMAAQYAGLEVVERNPHYTVLSYIRPGFDATLWFGYQGTEELDMKLRNDTGSDVEIREYVTEDGFLVAEIWGVPTGEKGHHALGGRLPGPQRRHQVEHVQKGRAGRRSALRRPVCTKTSTPTHPPKPPTPKATTRCGPEVGSSAATSRWLWG